ncbi:MAG: endonuclease III [Verrucomicrobia bacterium]|nr:endonuclease III [Verrucomicrobiota bacterium]
MPTGSTALLISRTRQIISKLKKTYPDAHCELDHADPLQLLIATILSAQCTDARVNKVTPALFARCRTARDFSEISATELENLIRTTGFFRSKAKSIRGCATALVKDHGGEVPQTMEHLHQLPGVGRKTANVVLGNAFNLAEGIVVDTHVGRLSRRMGLTRQHDPVKVEQALVKIVPREDWTLFSHLLIWHGRRRCSARKPDCSQCEISTLCPKRGVRPRS